MTYIALVDVTPTEVTVLQRYDTINAPAFVTHWNNGVKAQQDWETLCQCIYTALIDADLLTPDGFDLEGYDMGSFIRLFLENKDKFPDAITGSIMFGIVVTAFKQARKLPSMKKGREINVNMDRVTTTLEPITPIFLAHMQANPVRAAALGDAFEKLIAQFSKPATN